MKSLGPEKEKMDRRKFCNRALIGSAGVLLMAKGPDTAAAEQHENLAAYPPVKIEGAEKVMPGSFLYFNYPKRDDPAILVRSQEGEYLAFSRKCAHKACSVDFDPSRRCFNCPCHQGAYDSRTGSVLYGPPPRPLDQIILQVRGGGEVWAVGRRVGTNKANA
jgi:Rieske Fe-S protein